MRTFQTSRRGTWLNHFVGIQISRALNSKLPAWPAELSWAPYLWTTQCGSYAEGLGNFIPGKSNVFCFMRHWAPVIGMERPPTLSRFSLNRSMVQTLYDKILFYHRSRLNMPQEEIHHWPCLGVRVYLCHHRVTAGCKYLCNKWRRADIRHVLAWLIDLPLHREVVWVGVRIFDCWSDKRFWPSMLSPSLSRCRGRLNTTEPSLVLLLTPVLVKMSAVTKTCTSRIPTASAKYSNTFFFHKWNRPWLT